MLNIISKRTMLRQLAKATLSLTSSTPPSELRFKVYFKDIFPKANQFPK